MNKTIHDVFSVGSKVSINGKQGIADGIMILGSSARMYSVLDITKDDGEKIVMGADLQTKTLFSLSQEQMQIYLENIKLHKKRLVNGDNTKIFKYKSYNVISDIDSIGQDSCDDQDSCSSKSDDYGHPQMAESVHAVVHNDNGAFDIVVFYYVFIWVSVLDSGFHRYLFRLVFPFVSENIPGIIYHHVFHTIVAAFYAVHIFCSIHSDVVQDDNSVIIYGRCREAAEGNGRKHGQSQNEKYTYDDNDAEVVFHFASSIM